MTYYAVIDTNVVVSSFLRKGSIPDQVLSLALDGPVIPILHSDILAEYRDVLLRNKFGITTEEVENFLSIISERAFFLDRSPVDEVLPDLNDVVFYEVSLTAYNAINNSYLVTGNLKDFPKKPFIVSPREMLEIIEKGSN